MKLVRDRIPELYKAGQLDPRDEGREEFTFRRPRGQEELLLLLRLKLAEEVGEVLSAPTRKELAAELGDLLDVIDTLAALSGIAHGELGAVRRGKRHRVGNLVDGWVLE